MDFLSVDESSPLATTELGTAQWMRLQQDHPDIPLTVVPFRATRNYAPVDSPLELGRAIEDFLAGRSVRGKPRDPALTAFRASPRSAATQVLGATEVEIQYYSSAARGRTIWGGVVPWESLWRAGANAATRIRFSRDVAVEGRRMEAGAYALFVIPREDAPWTVVFSNTDIQSGSFTYDSAYDALRLDVPAEMAEHEEQLRSRIEPRGPLDGVVEMSWAGRWATRSGSASRSTTTRIRRW